MYLVGHVLLRAVLPATPDSIEGVHGKPGAGSACLACKQSKMADCLQKPGGQTEAGPRNTVLLNNFSPVTTGTLLQESIPYPAS